MSYLAKLKGRSSEELLVRGTQEITALLERYRILPDSRELSDRALGRRLTSGDADPESLLARFRRRSGREFFPAFADPEGTVATLRRCWPSAERELIERADRAVDGKFDVLGYRELSFGSPVDWHLDPIAGRRAPRRHWSRIPYLRPEIVGDHKVIWELNRHQHFALLGQAYWLTGDERYARAFASQLTSWMDANRPKVGINWASSLEVAFRSISWLWGLYFFRRSRAITPALFARALKYLYLHGRHLESYLSTYFSPNTHLTGEALGLFYLGTLLPGFKRARRWQELGWRILVDEMRRQVRADGVYFEQSTWYHRYTADFYLHALLLARANEWPVDVELTRTVQALLDHLMYVTRPDGRTPLIGDDDGGQLVRLAAAAPNDFRGTLALGAMVLQRGDYARVAGAPMPDALWTMGPLGLERFAHAGSSAPAETSVAYAESGLYVMRDGWSDEANYLVADCGVHGALSSGHSHADALSFELCAFGRALIVDPGTYTYVGDGRNAFRSSLAHNTLVVDGASSSIPGLLPFKWREVAEARATAWVSQPRFDYFEGEHDGYERLASPTAHRRALLFVKGRYWVMIDRVESKASHRVDVRLQCAPGVSVAQDDAGMLTLALGRRATVTGLRVCAFGAHGAFAVEDGWVSTVFGARVPAPLCRYVGTIPATGEIVTVMMPWRGRQPEARAVETVVDGGRSIVVATERGVDVVLLRDAERVRAVGMETDARVAWLSREPGGRVVEFVLVDGSLLRVDGHEIIRRTGRGGWIAGRRDGGMWSISTGALLDVPERA
jgi:hypothetical protein